MVVHLLARNFLIVGSATGMRAHSSRPVSMAGANAVHVTTTVTRAINVALTVYVEDVDDPDKAWQLTGTAFSMTSGTAQAGTAIFTVVAGWVRVGVTWEGMTGNTAQAVLDIDLNTCLL